MMEKSGKSGMNRVLGYALNNLSDILYRVILGIVIIGLYFGIIGPLLFNFVIPPLCVHSRIESYTQEEYVQFEDSDEFQAFLDSLDFLKDGEAASFYHVDHVLRDNPIYGKHFDVFALDVELDANDYALNKESIENGGQYCLFGRMGDYNLYSLESLPFVYVLCFCDTTKVIRCILITDLSDSPMLDTLFAYHTDLIWNYEP